MRRRQSDNGLGAQKEEQKNNSKLKPERTENVMTVVKISAICWICCGFIIGSVCGGPWLEDIFNWVRGYRWNYVDRCIVEAQDSGYGVDFCRTPVDCSMCEDLKKIDQIHVNDLTVDMFEERFAYSGRPLVVRNATVHWKAMQLLDYNWLKDAYLSDPEILETEGEDCWFNQYKTKELRNLRTVFKLPSWRIHQFTGHPWYVGWAVCEKPVVEMLHELYERPAFISPDSTPPKRPWIFIGTPGYGAHSHLDNVGDPTWQAQIRGIKTWYLTPPPECRWSCHGTLEVTMYPGDIIILDTNRWFHATLVEGNELSVVLTNEYD